VKIIYPYRNKVFSKNLASCHELWVFYLAAIASGSIHVKESYFWWGLLGGEVWDFLGVSFFDGIARIKKKNLG
jgi:hypothetical protein